MSNKRRYKNRLPAVLPPAPRTPTGQQISLRAPSRPPEQPRAPRVATPPPAPPGPRIEAKASAHAHGPLRLPVMAALVASLVALVAGGVVVWRLGVPEDRVDAGSAMYGWPKAGESRTVTQVHPGGALEVTHWIHASEPLDKLELELPEAADSGTIEASAFEVLADGRRAYGPDEWTYQGPLADRSAVRPTFFFDRATRIHVRYQLSGAVELSTSAVGRGLATTTALDVSAIQPTDTRVVRSQAVLSLACAAPAAAAAPPEPCGESDSDRQWRVQLTGQDAGARVVASVTVP